MRFAVKKQEDILCMSSLVGKKVKRPAEGLNFSFYFSVKQHSVGPMVKVSFNPERLRLSQTGNLELTGDFDFTPGKDDKDVSSKDINRIKRYKQNEAALQGQQDSVYCCLGRRFTRR